MPQCVLRRDSLIGVKHKTLVKEVGEVSDNYMTTHSITHP